MSSFLFELAFGLLLGFSLTIPPGPMNAFIASYSTRAYREGLTAGVGAMSADGILGVLVFALRSLLDLSSVLRWVYFLGAGAMACYGILLLKRASGPPTVDTAGLRTYTSALGLGLSNPLQIVWWLTAGLAFAYLGGLVLFVGLFGAIAVWVVAFPFAVHLGARSRPRVARAVVVVSGMVIFAFAAYFLYLALL